MTDSAIASLLPASRKQPRTHIVQHCEPVVQCQLARTLGHTEVPMQYRTRPYGNECEHKGRSSLS